MQRKFFHPGPFLLVLAAATHAQTHKVAESDHVTRAIGVYEWTGELNKPAAARLIPVSIFIDGKTEDAGVYLARPVPFVLQTGDAYLIERAGEPQGTLSVEFAKNIVTRHSAGDDSPVGAWYGYGKYLTQQEEARLDKLKPSAKPAAIVGSLDGPENPDDDKPHFVRRAEPSASPSASSGTAAGGTASTKPSPVPDDADDPDRPTLRHRDPEDETKKKKEKPSGYVSAPNTPLNDDPDRPTLRRGVPVGETMSPQLSGLPPNLHQAVAVSDATDRDDHSFVREWEYTGERSKTLAGIEELAQPRLANYVTTNKLSPVTVAPKAGPAFSHARGARANVAPVAQAPSLALANEEIEAYTLSYGGLPTFVYTVESPLVDGGPVYLTLVVQRLPAGELQVALSSITDASHLDRVPWMRPVDVVDPDWSHRASLLFELRAQTGRQFALYQLVSAKAEQTFVTGIIE